VTSTSITDACFVDKSGNVILVGSFYGAVNIATPYTSLGRRDAIVAKWSPNGTPLWSKRVGFKSVDTGWAGAADVGGSIIMAGSTGPHPNERDAFLARYLPDGTQQWIKYFVSSGPDSNAYVEVVATDGNKHIHAAGAFNGTINLGGSTLVAQGENDIFWASSTPWAITSGAKPFMARTESPSKRSRWILTTNPCSLANSAARWILAPELSSARARRISSW
jgi:hypothetical protein